MAELSQELQNEGGWFFQLLLTHGSDTNSALRFQKALLAGSGVLNRYAKVAWNNNLSPCPDTVTPEEKQRAGAFMVALDQLRSTPGPKPRGVEGAPLQVPLTPDERGRLERYCKQRDVSLAHATREGLKLLPGWDEALETTP